MNKRARLTRRILRDHRRGADWHPSLATRLDQSAALWFYWSCTHCSDMGVAGFERDKEIPVAYR